MYQYPRITKFVPEYQEFNPDGTPINYGWFGYKGASVDAAIKNQDVDALDKAAELGWINPNTPKKQQMFDCTSLVEYCFQRGYPKSAEKLMQLGFER